MSESNGILPTSDGHHDREDMRLAQLAKRKGWKERDDVLEKMPDAVTAIWADTSKPVRDRLRAMELQATLRRDNIAAESKPSATANISVEGGLVFNIMPLGLPVPHLNGHSNGHANGVHENGHANGVADARHPLPPETA